MSAEVPMFERIIKNMETCFTRKSFGCTFHKYLGEFHRRYHYRRNYFIIRPRLYNSILIPSRWYPININAFSVSVIFFDRSQQSIRIRFSHFSNEQTKATAFPFSGSIILFVAFQVSFLYELYYLYFCA